MKLLQRLRHAGIKFLGGYTQKEYDLRWRHEANEYSGIVDGYVSRAICMERIIDGCDTCGQAAHAEGIYYPGVKYWEDVRKILRRAESSPSAAGAAGRGPRNASATR